ncbi:MAG: magnetosome biogenesis CDF transporter MamM [Alphaproteobacteria bacterium]
MRYSKCVACSRTIGWVGLGTNLVLMVMKTLVGLVSGSQAMVMDAMYSAKDVVSSLLVIVGVSVSDKPLDEEHPYGHGKIEFVLSLIISIVFLAVTAYLLMHAFQMLLDSSRHRTPHIIALWAALVSVGVNLAMYRYARCVGNEINSPMVRTLAKHSHSDAVASGVVAGGIVGAHYLGLSWLDLVIAIFEALDLLYLGGQVFWEAYKGLMDRSVQRPLRDNILRLARGTPGVIAVRLCRARHVGQEISIEMVLVVDRALSVADAQAICDAVKQRVSARVPHIGALQVSATGGDGDEIGEVPLASSSRPRTGNVDDEILADAGL